MILALMLACTLVASCGTSEGTTQAPVIPGLDATGGTTAAMGGSSTSVTTETTAATASTSSTAATKTTATAATSVSTATTKPTSGTTATTQVTTKKTQATQATTVAPKNITIFLDPGHGGSDPGVVRTYDGVEYHESDINLAVALEAKKELEKRGYTVVMSRETDKWVDLEARAPMAQEAGAAMFVSVHVNSFHDKSVAGTRVYYTKRTGLSYNAYNFAKYFQKQFEEIRSVESSTSPGSLAYPNMKAVRICSDEDLYGKGGYLAVLAAKEIPSVLIELGFITNENDFLMLKSPWWQLYSARAIADAVDAAYEGGVYAK